MLNHTKVNWSLFAQVFFAIVFGLAAMQPGFALAATTAEANANAGASGHSVTLLSAFFGLDNNLPFRANLLCIGASGKDGMPVVLSHTIDPETLEPEDFQVVTRSGTMRSPDCVTLRPAQDAGELRTVLLIGEFGNANDDPPVSVQVVGDLLSDGAGSGGVRENYRGLDMVVTPLAAGPSLVLAERVSVNELAKDTRGTSCPEGVQQVVRVTWAGGVRRPNRNEPGDAERKLYRVTVKRGDGSHHEVAPAALGDLDDGDNNHLLCLDTTDTAISVSFPAGYLVDPNQDLNPDTRVIVNQGAN